MTANPPTAYCLARLDRAGNLYTTKGDAFATKGEAVAAVAAARADGHTGPSDMGPRRVFLVAATRVRPYPLGFSFPIGSVRDLEA
jgi:hypothetical protein